MITLGWVQDSGRFDKLHRVVQALASRGETRRADFLELIREVADVRRWADDNYARFAHALGFASYDRTHGTYAVTERGRAFIASSPNSPEEKELLAEAFLSYPPAVRVLDLLASGDILTKFEIGRHLGFTWEQGFSTYPISLLLTELSSARTARERNRVNSNREGTSDKYARMICGWLGRVGWVRRAAKDVSVTIEERTITERIPQSYMITPSGLDAHRRAVGVSVSRRSTKVVPFEMLCSRKQPNSQFLRLRRLAILDLLASGQPLSTDHLVEKLGERGITAAPQVVELDIRGLINCGLQILDGAPSYTLRDNLTIEHPPSPITYRPLPSRVEQVQSKVAARCTAVPEEYLDLIAFSFSKSAARFFETRTYELCTDVMGFQAELLGGAVQPDVLVWYLSTQVGALSYGVIVDCKARASGYSSSIADRRKMRDYIEVFTPILQSRGAVNIYFLFHTSFVSGGDIASSLRQIFDWTRRPGAIISSGTMYYLADKIASDQTNLTAIEPLFGTLREIDDALIDSL